MCWKSVYIRPPFSELERVRLQLQPGNNLKSCRLQLAMPAIPCTPPPADSNLPTLQGARSLLLLYLEELALRQKVMLLLVQAATQPQAC